MSQQEEDGGIFQFGHSVGFNDEMRRTTLAETEEIDKASSQIREAIGLEEKLRDQAEKELSLATKDIDNHLRTMKEAAERLSMDSEVLGGLANTLNSGFSMEIDPVEAVRRDSDYDEDVAMPTQDDRSLGAVKSFSDLAMTKAKICREKLEDFRKSLASRYEVVGSLNKDAADLETAISSQGLEISLTKSRENTSSKAGMLEELKVHVESTRSHILSSGKFLQDAEAEATSLKLRMAAKQQEQKAALATGNRRLSSEVEESIRLQEILQQVQKRTLEVTKDLETLNTEKEELASFVKAKDECFKRREGLRGERNQLYSYKKERECAVAVVKTTVDKSKRSLEDSEKAVDEVQTKKLKNDKDEVEVTLPAESELQHLACEKQAAKAILEESTKPTERCLVHKETSRLAELRSKRESIRKDFEAKRARLNQYKNSSGVVEKQASVDLDSLRLIAQRLAERLGEEKIRVDQLKARRTKRSEALRKLEVLRHGTAMIQSSKQVERDLSVY